MNYEFKKTFNYCMTGVASISMLSVVVLSALGEYMALPGCFGVVVLSLLSIAIANT